MNIDTGELVQISEGWKELMDSVFELPPELQEEAERAVACGETHVPLEGDSPLSQFRRDKLRQQAKARQARRRNNKRARRSRRR